MLIFAIFTWLALVALLLILTWHHYKRLTFRHIPKWFQDKPWESGRKMFQDLYITPFSPQEKWIHIGISLSFLYLAGSGFFYAALLLRPLSGLFLVLHMILGGIFGLGLALILILRAKDYPVAENWPDPHEHHWETISFWLFALSGFVLVLTALLMMLPLWDLTGHLKTVMVHRLAALSALLSAIAFVYFKWYRMRESK